MPLKTNDTPFFQEMTSAEFRAKYPHETGGGNKYNARRTWSEECQRWFDSKSEARHGEELLTLQRLGAISNLEYQPTWVLSDRKGMKVKCKADFMYYDHHLEKVVVEDVKGKETGVSRVKRAWLLDKLGIEVTVVWV